ncbi:substrate-binding domain-containing protein [Actinacidiphila oryziradicis]|uniref:sugar ABC transporter substrate-binding protein n=1 Tax=Actinacidiphila oryziradicis TaxID=2571141 RepID=UPI0023EF71AD|nr:substrate-binding domain-containing protein [Actinacidiphila oryziradicis]MCW2874668.1 periplasmic binding protein/LacI transcriptional regulator [Actinacidiphila oryziradicis]
MRLKRTACIAAIAAMATASLAACGSSSSDNKGGSGSKTKAKIGIILPDTKSSIRWESFDRPVLTAAFKKAGIPADIQNAENDKQRMATIAEQMITNGATMLAIVNLDNASGAAIEKKAAQQGVQTIDYDRLTLGGNASYYVSFDGTEVGRVQGRGLQKCMGSKAGNIVYLNGSPDDNNATLFKTGAHEILDKVTNYKKVAEQAVPGWDNQQAATIFEQMYTQQHGKIDGVLAANDGLAQAAISILAKNHSKIPVTGQDASPQGLQNILDGTQCMTVFKPAKQEADSLIQVVTALANGQKPQMTATAVDPVGKRNVPSILHTPIGIFKDNVKDVISGGGATKAQVCGGAYAAKCAAAGIQ